MRQGDYKYHFSGKFYLTDEEYSRLIARIQLQYLTTEYLLPAKKRKIIPN